MPVVQSGADGRWHLPRLQLVAGVQGVPLHRGREGGLRGGGGGRGGRAQGWGGGEAEAAQGGAARIRARVYVPAGQTGEDKMLESTEILH